MGDGDHGAGVLGEVALQPGHGLGVQVVGGLVEEEEVGALEEQPAQCHAAPLAAGEPGHLGVRRGQAQGVHGDLQGAVELPGVGGVDGVLDLALLGEQLVHLVGGEVLAEAGVDVVEPLEERAGLGDAFLDIAEDVFGVVEPGLLRQVADLGALGGPGLAGELCDLAGHDLEQRALAGAVQAQHADLRSGEEREPDALEDLAVGGIDLPQVFHDVDVLFRHMGRAPTELLGGCRRRSVSRGNRRIVPKGALQEERRGSGVAGARKIEEVGVEREEHGRG
jgi:hypothetical protein